MRVHYFCLIVASKMMRIEAEKYAYRMLFGRLRTLQKTQRWHFLRVWTHHPWCGVAGGPAAGLDKYWHDSGSIALTPHFKICRVSTSPRVSVLVSSARENRASRSWNFIHYEVTAAVGQDPDAIGQRHARRHCLFDAHDSRWHQTFFSFLFLPPCKVLNLPCGKETLRKWREKKMSEDSWAVAVDVQEATRPSTQVAWHLGGGGKKGGDLGEKVKSNCSSPVSNLARRAT